MKKASLGFISTAVIAMVVFAVSGFKGNLQIAEIAIFTSGITGLIFLIMRFIIWRRERF